MAVKATLIALPSDKLEVLFNEFPTFGILQDAVAQEGAEHFSDLLDGLETDDINDYEQDFDEAGHLLLACTTEGKQTGILLLELITLY